MQETEPVGANSTWLTLFRIIRDSFPYSKMRDLHISGGAAVAYRGIEYTLALSPGAESSGKPLPEDFDEHWLRLIRFCREKGDCILREVHFKEGRPFVVYLEQEGMSLGR